MKQIGSRRETLIKIGLIKGQRNGQHLPARSTFVTGARKLVYIAQARLVGSSDLLSNILTWLQLSPHAHVTHPGTRYCAYQRAPSEKSCEIGVHRVIRHIVVRIGRSFSCPSARPRL